MKKRIFCMLLAICMVISLLPTINLSVFAAEGDIPSTMTVEPNGDNCIYAAIKLYKTSGSGSNLNFDLYLPGDADVSKCFFSWANGLQATYNGKTYASGQLPIPAPGQKATYSFTKGSSTTNFNVSTYQGSPSVRSMFIEIDETQGTISAMNSDPDHEKSCKGIVYIDGEEFVLDKMKGRGNATWSQAREKRGYNLTLGTKTVLLGMDCGKTKKYSILSNIGDHTLLRNKIGFDMARAMGVGQDAASIDVWMNGNYMGTYLITPKTDSYITDDGYGLENDNYREKSIEEGGDPQFDLEGMHGIPGSWSVDRITVKKIGDNVLGPEGETVDNLKRVSADIQDYMQEVWDAIRSESGYNSQGKYYADYLDIPSWAAMYLMQEYIKSYDANGGSILFYRNGTDASDKLYGGPLWDLDNALGSTQINDWLGRNVDQTSGNGWFIQYISDDKTVLFKELGKHEDFMEAVYQTYNRYHEVFDEAPGKVRKLAAEIAESAAMNFKRITRETYNNSSYSRQTVKDSGTEYEQVYKATNKWEDYVDNLVTFMNARSLFFRNNLTREDPGFRVSFERGANASVTTYDTQDVSAGGNTNAMYAFARNSDTGEIDLSGDGQVNFTVAVTNGYSLVGVHAEPAQNFKNLKTPADTGVEGLYRLTKVTGPVTVTVETAEVVCDHVFDESGKCTLCGKEAFQATFDCDEHCSVTSYLTQDLTTGGTPNAKTAFARASADGAIDVTGEGQVGFVVNVDEGFEIASITAEPANYKNFKFPEETGTLGYYRLTKVKGDFTVKIRTKLLVPEGASTTIDFTKSADAEKYEILSQKNAKVTEGTGVKLTATRPAFEDCNGQNSGDQATKPEDVIAVPVKGDWTATLRFDFSKGSAGNGYYQFFGFYAGEGEGYQNLAGIRGGDGAMQNFLRRNGSITADSSDLNSTPGLASAGTYWYQIKKDGSTYTCLRSSDGKSFTEMFSYKNTGIEADTIYIDAYTGMTEGYEFTLKSLDIEGAECDHSFKSVVTAATCLEGGYTTNTCSKCGASYVDQKTLALGHDYQNGKCTRCGAEAYLATFVCDEHCSITAYDTQVLENGHEKAASAMARSSDTGEVDVSGNGQVNFVVVPEEGYEMESIVVEPTASYKNLKGPDDTLVENGYRITKVVGSFTVTVTSQKVSEEPDIFVTIDFTKGADASKYDVINQRSAQVTEGTGVKLTATRAAFEDCNGQNSGDQATKPEDVIAVPVSGDWTATLRFDFSTGSAGNGYYQFFGFYAGQGDEYQNLAGIRGGDGAMQNFLRRNGSITADSAELNSTPGLAAAGTYWYQIKKEGSTYTCLRSSDGKSFTEMFSYEDTGIKADNIYIDAYTGMTEGYEFTLKSLNIVGAGVEPCEHDYKAVVTAATCLAGGYTTYTCARCEDSYVGDKVAALGHDYKGVVTAATCLADGYTTYTCTRCEDSYVDDEVAALGHDYKDGKCTRCGEIDPEEIMKFARAAAEAANSANEAAKDAAKAAQQAAEDADAAAGDLSAALEAKAAAEAAQARAADAQRAAEAALAAADAADADAAKQAAASAAAAAEAAAYAAEAAKAQAATAQAQLKAEAAKIAAEAAQARADEAAKQGDDASEETKDAQKAAEEAREAAEAAMRAADAAADAAEKSNAAAANAARQAAADAAELASAKAEVAAAKAEAAKLLAAAAREVSDAAAARKAAEEAKKIAEHAAEAAKAQALEAEKTYALIELAIVAANSGVSDPAVIEAAAAKIEAAETIEDMKKALEEAIDALGTEKCPSEAFSDAPEKGNWAHEGIDYCIVNGYMNGIAPNIFAPNAYVTRAQLVTILYRVAGEPATEFKGIFSDVEDGQWYSAAIEWAAANDVVNGVGESKFNPMGYITREQIAAILYRYSKGLKVEGDLEAFADGDTASSYAVDALAWAVQEGLIAGIKSGDVTILAPKDNATRAQIASIIMRFIEK